MEQRDLIRKGRAYQQMVQLMQEDEEFAYAFRQAIAPRYCQYPLLIDVMKEIFEWMKELMQKIAMKFS